ncbi:MAG: DUF4221 family protein [Bacteroidota bacterium]
MKLSPFVVLVFLLFIYGCQNQAKEKSNSKNSIIFDSSVSSYIVDSYKINLDPTTPIKSPNIQYLEEKNQLAMMNASINEINIYDLESAKLDRKVKLEESGPNGVGKVRMFRVYEDKLYVLNPNQFKFFQLDFSGNVIKKYDLNRDNAPKPKATTWQPLIIDWPYAYMASTPYRDYNSKSFYEANDLMTRLNLETEEIAYSITYPDKIKGNLWGPNLSDKFYTYNSEQKKFIISWPPIADLSVGDFNDMELVSVPSKYNIKPEPVDEVPRDFNKRHAIFTTNPQYSDIFYNKYKNEYYRIVEQRVPEKYIDSQDYDEKSLKPFSLMVLDSDLNVKKEIEFPHLKYYHFMVFITKKGLYMAKIPENEDELVFDCFQFDDNEKV